jgi:hypothetical protein
VNGFSVQPNRPFPGSIRARQSPTAPLLGCSGCRQPGGRRPPAAAAVPRAEPCGRTHPWAPPGFPPELSAICSGSSQAAALSTRAGGLAPGSRTSSAGDPAGLVPGPSRGALAVRPEPSLGSGALSASSSRTSPAGDPERLLAGPSAGARPAVSTGPAGALRRPEPLPAGVSPGRCEGSSPGAAGAPGRGVNPGRGGGRASPVRAPGPPRPATRRGSSRVPPLRPPGRLEGSRGSPPRPRAAARGRLLEEAPKVVFRGRGDRRCVGAPGGSLGVAAGPRGRAACRRSGALAR